MQRFFVNVKNVDTGEQWEAAVNGVDPPAALATFCRRKIVTEWLCSEQTFRFVVSDNPGPTS